LIHKLGRRLQLPLGFQNRQSRMEIPGVFFWILAGSASVLALFYLAAAIAFLMYRRQTPGGAVPGPLSAVVAAKNELENLRVLLPVLLEQDYPDFELVVVDDRSDDGTYEYLLEESRKNPRLRMVRIDDTPDHISRKKYALTLGIRAARHGLILLCDADCRPLSPSWMACMAAPFSDPGTDIVLGYSQYERRPGFLNLLIRFETLYTGFQYLSFALLGRPYMGVGRNLAYRKELFLKNNGFGRFQRLVGGDDDLFVQAHARRRNTRVQIGPECLVASMPAPDWSLFFRQKKRHLSVGKHYNWLTRALLGVLFLARWLFWSAAVGAIVAEKDRLYIILVIIVTLVLFLGALLSMKRKSGDRTSLGILPILDIAHLLGFTATGVATLLTKKVKWN
jgi:glycosyltransferase involved in cell wall biosynthesis